MNFRKLSRKSNEKKFSLAGLRDKKFEAIHEEMLDIVFCKSIEYFMKRHQLKMIGKVEYCILLLVC